MPTARWWVPAILATAFLGFTLWVAYHEGLFGFITEHSRNFWGYQIAIDLVTGISVALLALAPRAQRLGISMVPWVVLTILTGSIGLLALFARLAYAESRARS